jgi:hypothetical protein
MSLRGPAADPHPANPIREGERLRAAWLPEALKSGRAKDRVPPGRVSQALAFPLCSEAWIFFLVVVVAAFFAAGAGGGPQRKTVEKPVDLAGGSAMLRLRLTRILDEDTSAESEFGTTQMARD